MKIGILGGTFNPVHNGHLALASLSAKRFSLDKVIFVPSSKPPHKEVEYDVSSSDRLAMVKLAVEGNIAFEVSTFEIDRKGPSYTIDTIRYLKEKSGDGAALYFLSGADAAAGLEKWKDIDKILQLCVFVVATRPGWSLKSPYEGKITAATLDTPDISSSMIRSRLVKGLSCEGLLPDHVAEYIRKTGIYRS